MKQFLFSVFLLTTLVTAANAQCIGCTPGSYPTGVSQFNNAGCNEINPPGAFGTSLSMCQSPTLGGVVTFAYAAVPNLGGAGPGGIFVTTVGSAVVGPVQMPGTTGIGCQLYIYPTFYVVNSNVLTGGCNTQPWIQIPNDPNLVGVGFLSQGVVIADFGFPTQRYSVTEVIQWQIQ